MTAPGHEAGARTVWRSGRPYTADEQYLYDRWQRAERRLADAERERLEAIRDAGAAASNYMDRITAIVKDREALAAALREARAYIRGRFPGVSMDGSHMPPREKKLLAMIDAALPPPQAAP